MKNVQKMVAAMAIAAAMLIAREVYDLRILSYLVIIAMILLCASGLTALGHWIEEENTQDKD